MANNQNNALLFTRLLLIFFLLLTCCSCSREGYYYTNSQGSGEETIAIDGSDGAKRIELWSYIVDSSLTVVVAFKLIDTSGFMNVDISKIYFTINGVSSQNAEKSILFIDSPLKMDYDRLSDIQNLKSRIHTGLPLEFLFKYNVKDIPHPEKIQISIHIDLSQSGNLSHFQQEVKMIRRARYVTWFRSH
jgi:hypothetical protein